MINPIVLSPKAWLDLTLLLRPGQVVRLVVVEAAHDGAIVSLGGRLFRAEGELPARPGEAFTALVESAAPHEIRVRPLPAGGTREAAGPTGDLLRALELPSGRESEHVVRELLRQRLPVARETVLRLLAEMRGVPEQERAAWVSSRVWLESLGWERPEHLRAALEYLLGRASATPEGHEALNRAQPPTGQDPVYVLSLNGGERFNGQVFVRRGGQGKPGAGRETAVRLVVRLETRSLGEVWCRLDLDGGGLAARICLADEQAAERARAATPNLERLLAGTGYAVRGVAVERRRVTGPAELLFDGGEGKQALYRPLDARV
ncbi:MAG: hypothetical protein QMC81_04325 [Thermoanaerobacterales bacterium]|nr:hypothetical protein [Thermoanaerobacterales bacterium]